MCELLWGALFGYRFRCAVLVTVPGFDPVRRDCIVRARDRAQAGQRAVRHANRNRFAPQVELIRAEWAH